MPGLVKGIYGTKAWMAHLGQKGGQVKSEAKSEAAKMNGKKVRPLKNKLPPSIHSTEPSERILSKLRFDAKQKGMGLDSYLIFLSECNVFQESTHKAVRDSMEPLIQKVQSLETSMARVESYLLQPKLDLQTNQLTNSYELYKPPVNNPYKNTIVKGYECGCIKFEIIRCSRNNTQKTNTLMTPDRHSVIKTNM